MPPADPREAGRKGGRSRSAKKLAAIRKNGFQKVKPAPDNPPAAVSTEQVTHGTI